MTTTAPEKNEYGEFTLSYTVWPRGIRPLTGAVWTNSLSMTLKAVKMARKDRPRVRFEVLVRASDRRKA